MNKYFNTSIGKIDMKAQVKKAIETATIKEQLKNIKQNMKNEITEDTARQVFVELMVIPAIALKDQFGFGKVRLNRYLDEVFKLYKQYENGEYILEDLKEVLEDEADITITSERKRAM